MATLVIKSFPEDLHAKLKEDAAEHRRSITQQAIVLLEKALEQAEAAPPQSYWKTRQLLPEFEAVLRNGAFEGGTDSAAAISEERSESEG